MAQNSLSHFCRQRNDTKKKDRVHHCSRPPKKLESYKKIKLFRCYKCLSLPGHPYLLCGIGKSFCRAGVDFHT